MLLNPQLRAAQAADWPAIADLLTQLKLPLDGARDHLDSYLLALSADGSLQACAGAELYGPIALLRSVAVQPALQQQGLGRRLVEQMLQQAQRRQIASVYLLSVGAPEYFARFGFKRIRRSEAPAALSASAEFQGACPDCAALMRLDLQSAIDQGATAELPIAVLGAGPVGLAALAHLQERGLEAVVLEAGPAVAMHLRDYAHVQLFSPWRYNIDAAMARQLQASGWQAPPDDALPSAGEVVRQLLEPFAALPPSARALRFNARVQAISREGLDKMKSSALRDGSAFVVRYLQDGQPQTLRARAVIDATGTWGQPNPLGADGLSVPGEAEARAQIAYGIPDILGAQRGRYAGRRTLVVGAGHSAANALLDLAKLATEAAGTRLVWAIRGASAQRAFGGGAADALPARGALGSALRRLRESGTLSFHAGLRIEQIHRDAQGRLQLLARDAQQQPMTLSDIDEIICATGQRPDLNLTRELRLSLDRALESTEALGPLIDPNQHSCGTVRPHGHRELGHPEAGFYTVGVKSYGRAPTFLMATGYEQVRSVVAALAGDLAAADRVELNLPETGVCSAPPLIASGAQKVQQTVSQKAPAAAAASCCGPQASDPVTADVPVPTKSRCCG